MVSNRRKTTLAAMASWLALAPACDRNPDDGDGASQAPPAPSAPVAPDPSPAQPEPAEPTLDPEPVPEPEADPPAGAELPTPPQVPSAPTPPTAGTPLPPLSPGAQALLEKSVAELETVLRAEVEAVNLPPSIRTQILDSYGVFAAGLEPGAEAERMRKSYLAQLVLAYRNVPRRPAGFDLPVRKLESILMKLDHPTSADQRRETLRSTVDAFSAQARTDADREYWHRYAIISLIQSFSGDQNYLEKHDAK